MTAVYPSESAIPENTLRFYVHFAQPMAPHRAHDHVQLRDATGLVDPAAFMRFKQELWNEDRSRLTVLVDPARIKRAVATNADLGPALVAGRRFALTVAAGWPTSDGSSLLAGHASTFHVTAPLRTRPDIDRWSWRPPRAGTREPLIINLDRPFDRHLLTRAVTVTGPQGQVIDGIVDIGKGERTWRLTPLDPWSEGELGVLVDPDLEDVAGNSVREVLDRQVIS